ncbi:FAD-dependent oxidoreductase [Microbacterium aurum]|uniref:protoporphyrinogen/coproporphyrinogen oxidase n=1 Tax=Microbacterium aurum TaxID=36805 RepID=UPI001EF5ECC1|nr:FAD-dependent oxidoreductase [Microbacterium aurum]
MSDRAADLISRAHEAHVVVAGGGVAGLVAALECAKVGIRVTVIEASDRLGGSIRTEEIDGLAVDLVADGFALGAPALDTLIDELGLRDAVEPAAGDAIAVAVGSPDALRVARLPVGLAGIPANPWSDDARRIIGWRGAWRAYLDRLRPPLTIGREQSLGALVRTRMGVRVRDRLVAPLAFGRFGVDVDDVDADLAVPGLSTALTRAGSLAGAISQLLPDGPAPSRATLRGGMGRLVDALAGRLADLEVEIRTGARVAGLHRDDAGWTVRIENAAPDAAASAPDADSVAQASDPDATGAPDAAASAPDADSRATPASAPGALSARDSDATPTGQIIADVVIIATDGDAAASLLASAGISVAAPASRQRDVVTLVVDAPVATATATATATAVAPTSSAPSNASPATTSAAPATVYAAPAIASAASGIRAAAVEDATASWPHLAAAAGPRRILRVQLEAPTDPSRPGPFPPSARAADGAQRAHSATTGALANTTSPSPSPSTSPPELVAQARRAASALLGAEVGEPRAAAHRRVVLAPPASVIGHAERTAAARAAIAGREGLVAVGAWLAGGGIAPIVADTVDEVEKVRARILFGRE